MNSLVNWLETSFTPKANKVFNNPWIACVSSSMQKVIPFILTGSVIYFYNVFTPVLKFLPDLSPIANFSFGLITLLVAFMIANQAMEKLNHPEYNVNAGLVSICMLIMVAIPFGENSDSLSGLLNNLGPAGMMIGMLVGLFVAMVFKLWANLKFMVESDVPDFVTNWLNTIFPTLITLGISMIVIYVFKFDVYNFILMLFSPIANIAQTLPGFILITFVPAFFYTLGISTWTWGAISTPIYLAAIQANIDAVAIGQAPQYIVTSEAVFTLGFITLGGICATLPLNILMIRSKASKLRTLGKIFIGPSIFNINEPIMFGTPIVFNPILMVPAWICSLIGPIFVWVLMSTNLLKIPSQLLQIGQIPAPICSVLVTKDMRAVIWYVIIFIIYTVIWYPFFKSYEKSLLDEEVVK
ncbi:MAG: PTS sugar transporter subunit IIC [Bacilli bacterium]